MRATLKESARSVPSALRHVSPKRLARRLVQVAVPGLFLTLAACGGNMEDPEISLNPIPKMRYEITISVVNPPGPFDEVEGTVGYQVDDRSCVPEAPISGAALFPSKSVSLNLVKVSANEFKGELFVDRLQDADYYGKGICHWRLQSAAVRLKGRPVTFDSSMSADDIFAQTTLARFYPNSEYAEAGPVRIDIGDSQRSAFKDPADTFSIEMKAMEAAK